MVEEVRLIQAEIEKFVDFFERARAQSDVSFVRETNLISDPQIFSITKLQDHLNNPLLSADWCQISLGGQAINLQEHTLWKTVQTKKLLFIDKTKLNQAIEKGASVVLEGLDILDSNINHLLSRIDQSLPCALSNCEAFFSQRGNEAYGGHRDSDDVLVLQISGEKRWNVHAPQQRRYIGNSPLPPQQMGPLAADFVMKPGDAMFLRAGVPHRCITEAPSSLHLSFDLCDRTPNIEQITHAANLHYNQGAALPNSSAQEVVRHYIQHLESERFTKELEEATAALRSQARVFRQRIDGTRAVRFFEQLIKSKS